MPLSKMVEAREVNNDPGDGTDKVMQLIERCPTSAKTGPKPAGQAYCVVRENYEQNELENN